ncbi:MAG: DinB family protein [Thermoflexales bacterium]
MLDFTPVREKKLSLTDLARPLSRTDLARLTNEMVDTMLGLIEVLSDTDVVFSPSDPKADDPYAASEEMKNASWTLGHLIVHATASAEEAAFLAAEMARGVPNHGRSRCETNWETVTTIALCQARLEESRRIRLAMLSAWPDAPRYDVTVEGYAGGPPRNCKARFIGGLFHDDAHLEQLRDVARQAKTARAAD